MPPAGISAVLLCTRASRPLFKLQEFGLSAFLEEMSPACKVALVADNADQYQDAYDRLPRMNAAEAA